MNYKLAKMLDHTAMTGKADPEVHEDAWNSGGVDGVTMSRKFSSDLYASYRLHHNLAHIIRNRIGHHSKMDQTPLLYQLKKELRNG